MIGCILEVIVTPLGAVIGVAAGVVLHLALPVILYVAGVRSKEPASD